MKAEDFDKKFDEGVEDIIDDLDPATARRPNREADRLGVTRQSIIKVWIAERLERKAS